MTCFRSAGEMRRSSRRMRVLMASIRYTSRFLRFDLGYNVIEGTALTGPISASRIASKSFRSSMRLWRER